MQFGKLGKVVAAGTMAAMFAGSTVAFAQLQNYPAPFVQGANADFLVVVGQRAAPSDVVGAIDLVARLGGERTTLVSVSGAVGGLSISGEGREVSTTNTKLYLGDSLGKSGVRSTLTKDDLPTLLANGVLDDADASTTHNYQQFIYLTPSNPTSSNYKIEFEKPGTSSSVDPTYSIGNFPTSPTASDYLYKTYVTFDKDVNGTTAVGEKIKLFGGEYTISSGTDFTASPAKLVLFGGADTQVISGGQTIRATVGGTSYDVTLVGASSATTAVIRVGSDQRSVTKGTSTKIGGLDVYVDDVFYLSQNDQTQNSAKLLLGSQKMTLQHNSKVKLGDTEDSVDGTYVQLTTSSGKLSAITVYVGGKSSSENFLKLGSSYTDPVWKSFSLAFPSVSPAPTDAGRSVITVRPSGDNVLELVFTEERGYQKTVKWAYKASATGSTLTLGDDSGNPFVVVEGAPITQDSYFVVDAGDFTHLFKLTGMSVDGTTSSNLEITDQFSGVTTKITLGADNYESKVIDGQTYYINASTTAANITWGTNAASNNRGDYVTVYPRLKGQNGEFLAFVEGGYSAEFPVASGTKVQLPTGAIVLTGSSGFYTIAATTKEDGTPSVLGGETNISLSGGDNTALISLGRTANGPVWYNLSQGSSANTMKVALVGASSGPVLGNASLLLVEEKDDNGDQYSVVVTAGVESSGSNQVAIPTEPKFTYTTTGVTLGSDSTVSDYVDLWGTWVRRQTSGQDTLTIYYPNDQVVANVAVLTEGATATTGGTTSGSVRTPVPIKSAVGKLDSEVTSADKNTKNLILVGGPAVNTLVGELAASGKTRNVAFYVQQGVGYFLIDYVNNAFATGKVALVVAGTTADDTRAATTKLQTFDTAGLTGTRAEFKNGVITALPA